MNIYTVYCLAIAFKMGRHRGRWCIQCRIRKSNARTNLAYASGHSLYRIKAVKVSGSGHEEITSEINDVQNSVLQLSDAVMP
nr:hypothetical protein [Escherichia coli]